MTFGKRLRDLRNERQLSQTELGKLFGLAGTTISQYESGLRFPDQKTLISICSYFDISSDYLLGLSSYNYMSYIHEKGIISCNELTEEQMETIQLLISAFISINKKKTKSKQE